MTDDYKKNLIDYITNLEPGKPTFDERFTSIEEVARSEYVDFIPNAWADFRLTGLIKSKTSDKVIFYGGYVERNGTYINNSKGIIIVADSDLKPIQTIYKYSSGTDLRPIQCLFQEEDGQFIGIDSTILYSSNTNNETRQALITNPKRVIMLNDISQPSNDEFVVNLRRSYLITGIYANFVCKEIFKNPSTSHYAFTGFRIVSKGNTYQPDGVRIIMLTINVGSANVWQIQDSDNDFLYGGANVYFDSSDNAKWKFLLSRTLSNQNYIYTWEGTNAIVDHTQIIQSANYHLYIDSGDYENQVAFISNTEAYYVMNNQRWGIAGQPESKYIGLYKVDFTTHTIEQIYLKSIGSYDRSDLDAMFLQVVNGELYIQYCDNVDTNNNTANYYVQRFRGNWSPILVRENEYFVSHQRAFYVSQSFNLLRMNIYPVNFRRLTWYMDVITEVYNIANYNGEPYENYNVLKSKYGNIYSNDKIVFSRNLHNLSITNNYSVSTIEVPNSYLNDINLNLKELVGETNVVLVEDGRTITKNIYEVLYLNYINTINVKDNNEEIQNDTARYINTNINTGTKSNYDNSKCTKVLVNYEDTTSRTFPIGWTSIDDTHKSTEFTIYVDKAISNIQLISNDTTQVYITIQQELEVGKYYTFKQYLKVE